MSPKKKNTIYTVVGISAVVIVLLIMNYFHVLIVYPAIRLPEKLKLRLKAKLSLQAMMIPQD